MSPHVAPPSAILDVYSVPPSVPNTQRSLLDGARAADSEERSDGALERWSAAAAWTLNSEERRFCGEWREVLLLVSC